MVSTLGGCVGVGAGAGSGVGAGVGAGSGAGSTGDVSVSGGCAGGSGEGFSVTGPSAVSVWVFSFGACSESGTGEITFDGAVLAPFSKPPPPPHAASRTMLE